MVTVRRSVQSVGMRAGTSRGLFFKATDLPSDTSKWDSILCSCMGSPDPFGRQLDGLGGGSSTTSKVAIVGPSADPEADVDYTFVQVPIGGPVKIDMTGNCGNMCSGVGPFAIEENLVKPSTTDGRVTIRIRNTNTGVLIKSTFDVKNGLPVEEGELSIPGVSTSGSPIRLDFVNPAGAMTGKLLPTGNPIDELILDNPSEVEPLLGKPLSKVRASMVDAANPFVFVSATDFGMTGSESSAELTKLAPVFMQVRCAASVAMGLSKNVQEASLTGGTPKIALLAPSTDAKSSDLQVRPYSMGLPHPSIQITGAVCLASACAIPGTIPNELVKQARGVASDDLLKIDHPLKFLHATGLIVTDCDVETKIQNNANADVNIKSASVYRTARRLFQGNVLYLDKEDPVNLSSAINITNGNVTSRPKDIIAAKTGESGISAY